MVVESVASRHSVNQNSKRRKASQGCGTSRSEISITVVIRPTTLFLLADRELNGQLVSLLRTWSAAEVSAPAMARMIHGSTGIVISSQTIRRWLAELADGAENGEAA